jgi:hypothetical protein
MHSQGGADLSRRDSIRPGAPVDDLSPPGDVRQVTWRGLRATRVEHVLELSGVEVLLEAQGPVCLPALAGGASVGRDEPQVQRLRRGADRDLRLGLAGQTAYGRSESSPERRAMDFPFLLLLLLALPFIVGAFIVVVSRIRRRRHAPATGPVPAPVHRGQADTGAVQNATRHPEPAARKVESGRERRAGSPKQR